MSGPEAVRIELTPLQGAILESIVRSHKSEQRLVRRAKIILLSAQGASNESIAQELGITRGTVRIWRKRWSQGFAVVQEAQDAEEEKVKELTERIKGVLSDEQRSGAPGKFTPEQIVQIIAMACENPLESGLAFSHWTPVELAKEAIRRDIVESISPRHVGRFLKGGRSQASSESLLAQRQP